MPAQLHLDPDGPSALVVLYGEVRWDHIAAALLGLSDHADFTPGLAVLWDARSVTCLDLPPGRLPALKALLEQLLALLQGGRTAVVVRRYLDAFMVDYLLRGGRCEAHGYAVFFELADARAFLECAALPTASQRALDVE